VVLVAVLATLQYHWLGQVSQAERKQLQESLRGQAQDFADAFDVEILWIEMAFQAAGPIRPDDAEGLARAYDTWRDKAKYPQIVRAVYLADVSSSEPSLAQLNQSERRLVAVAWPPEFAPIRSRVTEGHVRPGDAGTDHVFMLRDPIVASVPAVLVSNPVADTGPLPAPETFSLRLGQRFLVVQLDLGAIRSSILPALAAEHFAAREADSYRIAIVDAQDRSRRVFSRGLTEGATLDPGRSDAAVPMFAVRFELGGRVIPRLGLKAGTAMGRANVIVTATAGGTSSPPDAGAAVRTGAFAIYMESRTSKGDVVKVNARTIGGGAWELVLQHPAGSLDAAVASARRRNLWLSFSILAVLAAGVALVVANAQRAQRLAAQQMDFVATVSHELRTPLAVIRSAAQNLSAGVVHDPVRTRHYGEMIDNEGRRLTDMVEQVLEYAGFSGRRRPVSGRPLDIGALVGGVADSWHPMVAPDGIDLTLDIAAGLPQVRIDETAMRRALDNLVSNAVKYGAEGRTIAVAVKPARTRGREEVQVSVTDRGAGIGSTDLAHVFEPFYRGANAVDRHVAGNGLGLSLVKRIVEAHDGRVTVRSAPGQGSTFTIHLPAASGVPVGEAAEAGPR
jgi:signal transduction histidine kinase